MDVRAGISVRVSSASWLVPGHFGPCSASSSAPGTSWTPALAAVFQSAQLELDVDATSLTEFLSELALVEAPK